VSANQVELNDVSLRVLRLFAELRQESLDLHTLFELAGGNDVAEREAVFDAVENLVSYHMLEERGNDYYALTALGKRVMTLQDEWSLPESEPESSSQAGRVAIYALTGLIALLSFIAFYWLSG
jgi:hypothetical protein